MGSVSHRGASHPAEAVSATAGRSAPALGFQILGPLEVRAGSEVVNIRGHRRRVVLLLLLLEPGRVVTTDRLVEAVWDDAPPKTAATQVQICVSQLRSLFATATGSELIRTHAAGYYLQAPEETVDIVRFRRLVASARSQALRGERAAAASALGTALDLWRGEVGRGLSSRVVSAVAVRLGEERLSALQEWLELELALGRHQERIGELRELVTAYPLRERLHAQLALALYRAGRQAEALAACRQARQVLVTEHGIDPGPQLRGLERAILDNDRTLELPAAEPAAPIPRQLPAPPPDFQGRQEETSLLRRQLLPGEQTAPVVFISGAPGIGKSALAIQVAHEVQSGYPDGQLYAHLRSTDSVPVRPEQVLQQFLRALGAPPESLPDDLSGLAAQYRSWLAGRRILILLDDAAHEAQVRHLAPGDAGCALVVTSRHALPRLGGGHHLALGVLAPQASRAVLRLVIGAQRADHEPEATAALAELCDHLPLALQIAAAKLVVKPHWQIAQLVDRLRDERRRLDELTLDDVGVRPSVTLSYQALARPAARLLALLSTLGAADFAGWVAAPLLGIGLAEAAEALDDLVTARLVEVRSGAGCRARYRLHDLTRIFARERLSVEVAAGERAQAQRRLLRCWLQLASEAHRREYGGDHTVLHSELAPGPLPSTLVNSVLATPLEWLQTESDHLVAAVTVAAQLGDDDLCWDLAVTSVTLFENGAYPDAWRETHDVAMAAVQRTGNRRGQAALWYSRGGMALAQLRLVEAQADLLRAWEWFSEADDAHGRGLVLRDLASVDRLRGDYRQARSRGQRALADLRRAGDPVAEAHARRGLAQVALELGQLDEADTLLREALRLSAQAGARRIDAQVRYRLGQVLLARKELAAADECFHTVLAAAQAGRDLVGRAHALLGLGAVHLAQQEHDPAGSRFGEALRAARRSGSRLAEGQALLGLAEVRLAGGEPTAAGRALARAEAIFQEIDTPRWWQRATALRRRLLAATAGSPELDSE